MENHFLGNYFGDETIRTNKQWQDKNRRYFQIAGITICLECDLDFNTIKFKDELMVFAVDGSSEDTVTLRHSFEMPNLNNIEMGKEIYRNPPWAISYKDGKWFYQGISTDPTNKELHQLAVFNTEHTRGNIYNHPWALDQILSSGWKTLSLFPTDQIWLAPLLADRNAVLLHSAAAIINGRGMIFVGHSEAGKSTTMELLKSAQQIGVLDVEILCDDRNVIRWGPEGWKVHGTWSHGDITDVSISDAPLQAILCLEQSKINKIISLTDRKLIMKKLLGTLIRSTVTAKWWEKEMGILQRLVNEAPCYNMHFDKSGAIVEELKRLTL